ncbi:MAG: beta-lactamase family protein [Actinobacteria bacterium]|nr:beta-lactamase family protein [Actinomycetota bacterium]MBV9255051.1 beta-lactamase family protein [Actinomycetota bacterium]
MTLPDGVQGTCDPRFAAVAETLSQQLASGEHHGAAVAVRHRGEPVVDIWGGPGWAEDTMAISFSTTKGPAAVCLHMAMERNGISYDTPVAELWPEFGVKGKELITIRHCLCHEAGVPQIRDEIPSVDTMADWDEMVAMMERLEPLWEPGTANGYHAINYGWLVGELVRRIDGRPISQFLAEEVTGPLALDGCYIGTPESEHHRIAPLIATPMPEGSPSIDDFLGKDSIAARALSPAGNMNDFLNSPAGMSTCGPAFSGAFTARSLATIYSMMERGGELNGERLLKPETIATATTVQNTRPDLVIMFPIGWRLGFMSGGNALSPAGPNAEAYGHAGFGGSVGIADPTAELSLAIILDKLEINLLGGDRISKIVNLAVEAAMKP